MVWVTMVVSVLALGIALWLSWEVAGLKERWARLYGLRSAMVETETALQELMLELDRSGQTLLEELDFRLNQTGISSPVAASDAREEGLINVKASSISTGDIDDKRIAVIGLGQQGYTVEEIARRLGIMRGEVQLILDLERFRQ